MSTTFFNYGEPQISVSPSIWIYFVVAIPVSALILGGMMYWLRRSGASETKLADEENPRPETGGTAEGKGKLKLG